MKRKALSCILALTMCVALLVSGCGNTKSDKNDDGKKSSKKDEIHIAISANPPSLDPQSVNSNIVGGIGIHVYESLFAMDENYEPTPVLAESYEVSDDGMTYTIKLRQGVKFHNGEEMTADDVVASMNRWIETSPKANTLIGGSTFEKVDDYTVNLKVNQASSDIIMILASPIQFAAIYPAEVVESAGADGISEYIGTGPYKVSEWKQDQYVKLEKNEDYQPSKDASTGIAGEKKAATETLYFDVVTDAATRIAGLQNGQYDIAEEIPADNPKGLKPGDKVIVDPYIYCGECYPCSIGRTNCCTSLKVLGVHIDGGMAEYFCHPADMLVKMPEDMDWTDAAMAEPLTISLHGIHRGGLKAGEYCAIIGAGPIGSGVSPCNQPQTEGQKGDADQNGNCPQYYFCGIAQGLIQ